MKTKAIVLAGLLLPAAALGQTLGHDMGHGMGQAQGHAMDHGAMSGHAGHMSGVGLPQAGAPREAGQSAFAAIAEIVALLEADPATDWTRVDIEGLRQHLIDMDLVTLRADVVAAEVEGGATFRAVSAEARVRDAIRRMTLAHAATMDGVGGWRMTAETLDDGAVLTVTGEAEKIRALGFVGVLTRGMHHQAHHLALARGEAPH